MMLFDLAGNVIILNQLHCLRNICSQLFILTITREFHEVWLD